MITPWFAPLTLAVALLGHEITGRAQPIWQTHVVSFQKGVSPDNSFAGCLDSTLRSITGHTFGMQSLGRDESWNPRSGDFEGTGLIWFDVSSIPASSQVHRATLKLWFEPDEFDGAGAMLLFPLHDPDGTGMWEENEGGKEIDYGTGKIAGSALFKRPDVPWASEGEGRFQTVISTNEGVRHLHAARVVEWMTIDVTRDVSSFVDDASQNLGWILHSERDETIRGELHTADSPTLAKRPILEVNYGPSPNRAPMFDPLGHKSGMAGVPLTFIVSARDRDRDVITYGASNLPPGATFSGQTFQWTHPDSTSGTHWVTFYARDPKKAEDSATIAITVHPAPGRLVTTYVTPRRIPSLGELLAASQYLEPGDIPEDTFVPPGNFLFVAPGGSDTNPGTLAAPFEHLDTAITHANGYPNTAYTILLRGGIHVFKRNDTEIEIERGNLYIAGYGNETAVIRPFYWPNNPSNSWQQACFVARGAYTHLTFDNLTIEGWQIAFSLGASATNTMKQVVLKNILARNFRHRDASPNELRVFIDSSLIPSDVYGPGNNIFPDPKTAHFQIENLILSNVEAHDTDITVNIGDENDGNVKGMRVSEMRIINPSLSSGGNSANDALAIVNSYKVLIDHCTIKNVRDDGIDTKSYDVAVINSLVEGAARNGVKFWRNGELINSIVHRCTLINDGAIVLKYGPCRVIHSALLSKQSGFSGTLGYGDNPTEVGAFEIVNSIFYDLDHSFYVVHDRLSCRNSVFFDVRDCLFTGGVGTVCDVNQLNTLPGCSGNMDVNPTLSDLATGNFAPRAGSPCINAGSATGTILPSFDYFGSPRIFGLQPDIGPIEHLAARPLLAAFRMSPSGHHVLQWTSEVGAVYDLYSTSNLAGAWTLVTPLSGRVGIGEPITVTNIVPSERISFYRLQVR